MEALIVDVVRLRVPHWKRRCEAQERESELARGDVSGLQNPWNHDNIVPPLLLGAIETVQMRLGKICLVMILQNLYISAETLN